MSRSEIPPAGVQVDAAAAFRRARRTVDSVVDLIGDTPLVRLARIEPRPGVEIWGKCEFANPGGSVKDRPAYQMVKDAIAEGALTPDKTIIDSTSGNTGVAYSMVGAALGYRVTLVMPSNVSAARKQITRAYGTEIVFSSEMEGSDGAIRQVREMVAAQPERWFYPDQYTNESNPRSHYEGTGGELLAALGDRLTHFCAGIGTSGTVMGTGRRLHEASRARSARGEHDSPIRVVAVEPEDALHGLEGLKHMASSILPAIWRPGEAVDEVMPMSTEEGWDMTERIHREEGLFLGHSAGAAVAAALRIALRIPPGERACIACILPDRGDRYFAAGKWEKRYEW